MRRRLKIVGNSLLIAALIVAISFVIVTMRLGGDAVNGRIDGGRFYLGKQGGGYREVSERTWRNDRVFIICVNVAFPVAMLGGIVLVRLGRRQQSQAMDVGRYDIFDVKI